MKKLIGGIFFLLSMFLSSQVAAAELPRIYFFYGDGCPHCAAEEEVLDKIEKEGRAEILRYEVWHDKNNINFLNFVSDGLGVKVTGVPFTIIGEKTFTGFYNEETTGVQILAAIDSCSINGCIDVVADIMKRKDNKEKREDINNDNSLNKIILPIVGEVDAKNVSLPFLSILIGAIDGFNPCAMWALIFLIGLLLSLNDRRRMIIIGSSFLIVSALFYFLILNAWLNLIIFLKYIVWIKILIGLAGIVAGIFQLKDFKNNKEGVCKVTGDGSKAKTFDKIKEITKKQSLWIALGGVVLLAISVNMVELVCSLGLPVIFTQVLALSDSSVFERYLYTILYTIFFMADDIAVFVIALLTTRMKFFSTKYSRYSSLVGGLIMLIVGLLLIFKPEWLMFG